MKVRPLTFKDIEFKPHRVVKGGVQGLLNLPNNITVSIVGGSTLYGDGIDTFEVLTRGGRSYEKLLTLPPIYGYPSPYIPT